MDKILNVPIVGNELTNLKAGDKVLLDGTIYTGRDAAHGKMEEEIGKGNNLPFEAKGAFIYYVGPCPAPPGYAIGSAGPTTSGRMDKFVPMMLGTGLKGMIGKGPRSMEVVEQIKNAQAVYLVAVGGAAALLAQRITASEMVAYPELGPEAIYKLTVDKFPCIVAIDSFGNNLFKNR